MNLRQAADKAILGLVCPGQVYISPDVYAVMEQNRLVLTVRGQTVLLDVEACGRLEQAAYITRAEADLSRKVDNSECPDCGLAWPDETALLRDSLHVHLLLNCGTCRQHYGLPADQRAAISAMEGR